MSRTPAALNRDPTTLSSGVTRLAAHLKAQPVLHRELDRLVKSIKISKTDPDLFMTHAQSPTDDESFEIHWIKRNSVDGTWRQTRLERRLPSSLGVACTRTMARCPDRWRRLGSEHSGCDVSTYINLFRRCIRH